MPIISNGGMNVNVKDTMDAILLTKNVSYLDGVKLDVRMTLDNVIVICLDDELCKYTLSKEKVSNVTYHYLKKVKFPSHVFKYYIPTLEDVLKKYDNTKYLVLELYNQEQNIEYLNLIFEVITMYSYSYLFLVPPELFSLMQNDKWLKIGEIVLKDNVKYINNNDSLLGLTKDDLIITDCPKKVFEYFTFRQK